MNNYTHPQITKRYLEARAYRTPVRVDGREHNWLEPVSPSNAEIKATLEAHPYIVDFGCVGTPTRPRTYQGACYPDGVIEGWDMTPRHYDEVRAAIAWLVENVPACEIPTDAAGYPVVRGYHSSYALKHVMETQTGTYVSNGGMALAFVLMGFPFVIDVPNAIPGIHPKLYAAISETVQARHGRIRV